MSQTYVQRLLLVEDVLKASNVHPTDGTVAELAVKVLAALDYQRETIR